MSGDLVSLDYTPAVRRSDAITFMVHHLMLAAAFFEATPEGIEASLDEIAEHSAYKDDPKIAAAIVWLKAINERYEEMKRNDP